MQLQFISPNKQLTPARIGAAFTVAVLADLAQLPLNLLLFTGWLAVPSELGDMFIDAVTFGVTVQLLGFHWLLIPTAVLELLPIGDALPTWTSCVAVVVWQLKKENAATLRDPDVKPIEERSATPSPTCLELERGIQNQQTQEART